MIRMIWISCVLFIVFFVGCAFHRGSRHREEVMAPQGPLLPTGPPENQSYTEAFGVPEYLIGPGDVLRVSLWKGLVEERQSVAVQQDGTISFSFLPKLRVWGLTARQTDSLITKELLGYVKEPSIDIGIETYNSKKVTIAGALGSTTSGGGQGTYALEGKTRLLDILSRIGGFLPTARIERITFLRGDRLFLIDLRRLWEDGDITQNPILEGGDVIYVPWGSERRVFVVGEVKSPGVYLLSEDATVLEAVMRAGGFTNKAVRDEVKIVRGDHGSSVMLSVNVERIIDHKDLGQNVGLKRDDVVYVPETVVGHITDTMAQAAPFFTFMTLILTLSLRF